MGLWYDKQWGLGFPRLHFVSYGLQEQSMCIIGMHDQLKSLNKLDPNKSPNFLTYKPGPGLESPKKIKN